MTVNTVAFVRTTAKDVFIVLNLAANALNQLIYQERALTFPDPRASRKDAAKQFQSVETRVTPGSHMAQLTFKSRGEKRTLSVFFRCDCDHGGPSLSMSMGASGEAELFIYTVAHALSVLGPAYINRCDTSDNYEEVLPRLTTMAQAGAVGYIRPMDLDPWIDFSKQFVPKAPETLLGLPLSQVEAALTSYDSRKALLNALPAVAVPHLEEYHQRKAMS